MAFTGLIDSGWGWLSLKLGLSFPDKNISQNRRRIKLSALPGLTEEWFNRKGVLGTSRLLLKANLTRTN